MGIFFTDEQNKTKQKSLFVYLFLSFIVVSDNGSFAGFGDKNGKFPMTTSLSRDLIFLILQFLDEERFKDTLHK